MTIWLPDLSQHSGLKAQKLANAIGADITAGRLQPGEQLPPQRELAYQLGISVGTVTRAYAEARRRGLVDGQVGSGTYVRRFDAPETLDVIQPQANHPTIAPEQPAVVLSERFNFPLMRLALDKELQQFVASGRRIDRSETDPRNSDDFQNPLHWSSP